MPYFLFTSEEGIALKGNEFPAAPSPDWKPGSEADYLRRWDGEQWVDTETAQQFRATVAVEQAAIPLAIAAKQVADARALMTDKSPNSRANRIMARIITKRFGDVIDTVNVLIARENARGGTPIPLLTKTPWPQLLAAVRAGIAAETDPEA
jgi:hypothetical protein